MAYGFELRNADGSISMSSDNFGLQIVDDFVVTDNNSGSRTYPELDYFTTLYAMTASEYSSTTFHRALASHAHMDLTGSVDGSNIPTINWAPLHRSGSPSCSETSIATTSYNCSGASCHPPAYTILPSTRIIVMAA